jgi:serine phosphatase RsbU (regulator of sigma subunit)
VTALSDILLEVTDRQGQRTVMLDKPRITIGRRTASDLQVAGTDVSREHAELTLTDGRVLLRDIGSRCGTFVNGRRVTTRELVDGDRIRLGTIEAAEMVVVGGAASGRPTADATRVRHVAPILDGIRALGSGRLLDEVLTLVLDAALEVTKADRGFVMLANAAGELEFTAARAAGRVTLPGTMFATSAKIPREVYATAESRLVGDLTDEAFAAAHNDTITHGIRHVLCVPLLVTPPPTRSVHAPSRIIGVLYFDGRERSWLLSPAVVSMLEAFATQAAIAIESARLYAEKARMEHDLRIAAEIQRALLPPALFTGPTCALAAVSLPSRTVGGDFFDYFVLEDGLAFALGDVAGKGPSAALLAAVVQNTFAAQVTVAPEPNDVMRRLNEAMLRRAVESKFATMFYGLLAEDGTLRYCNAGHEPPLIVHEQGHTWLETGGPVVGLFGGAAYQAGAASLAPGDFVVICSDGVTEAQNWHEEEFGRDRAAAAVALLHGAAPGTVLDALLGALRRFCHGVTPHDDVTLMVVSRSAPQ